MSRGPPKKYGGLWGGAEGYRGPERRGPLGPPKAGGGGGPPTPSLLSLSLFLSSYVAYLNLLVPLLMQKLTFLVQNKKLYVPKNFCRLLRKMISLYSGMIPFWIHRNPRAARGRNREGAAEVKRSPLVDLVPSGLVPSRSSGLISFYLVHKGPKKFAAPLAPKEPISPIFKPFFSSLCCIFLNNHMIL